MDKFNSQQCFYAETAFAFLPVCHAGFAHRQGKEAVVGKNKNKNWPQKFFFFKLQVFEIIGGESSWPCLLYRICTVHWRNNTANVAVPCAMGIYKGYCTVAETVVRSLTIRYHHYHYGTAKKVLRALQDNFTNERGGPMKDIRSKERLGKDFFNSFPHKVDIWRSPLGP